MNAQPPRRIQVQLDADLLDRAEELGVDMDDAVLDGMRIAVERAEGRARRKRWAMENRGSLEAWGEWVERNGLLLSDLAVTKL
ncbi:type II toxin-antitoxin system CcdA family antitoxin [Jannaschia sp. LMIT008]|uniref:type II toxin-antitoxin system CcdA family antitoxin n=1 Tax=Jannaschia maritima TaxID=3032585 RepID=UPI002811A297|nr:type II toxin-antitoxin system CcdA family antitoxin [Jannaschia sp. LMIT008]